MAERELGILINARATGSNQIGATSQEVDKLIASMRQLEKEAEELNATTERRSRIARRASQEMESQGQVMDEMVRTTRQVREETEKHEKTLWETTKQWIRQGESVAQTISKYNSGRKSIIELAEWIGILEKEQKTYTHTVSQSYKELHLQNTSLEETKRELQGLTAGLRDSRISADEFKENVRDITEKARFLGSQLGQTGEEFDKLLSDITKAELGLGEYANKSDDTRGKTNQLDDTLKALGNTLDRIDDNLEKANQPASKLQTEFDKLKNSINKLSTEAGPRAQAFGNIISDALQDAARAAVEFTKESIQAFHEYDRSAREIFTLIPQASAEQREALMNDARLLGAELGRLPEEVLPSIYNALSSGVPQENVISTVGVAAKAAKAGVAELDDTLKVGLGIVNAYGLGVDGLEGVYDQLFFLIKNGVITMNDLNNGFSEVTSVAGEARVPLSDITAAIAVMTKQGDSAQEAFELLSTMLTQLSTEGTVMASAFQQAAGVGFREFIAQGGTLADGLALLQNHANDTGVALGSMLSGGSPFYRDTQAARAALELTGVNLQNLITLTNDAKTTTGEMAGAYAEFGDAAENNTLRAKTAWEEFKISFGEGASQLFNPLIGNATQFLNLWNGITDLKADRMLAELTASAEATGNWQDAAAKLGETWLNAQSIFVEGSFREEITANAEAVVAGIAASSVSIEDFKAKLVESGLTSNEVFGELAGYAFEIDNVFKANVNPRILEYTNRLYEAGTPTAELIALGKEYQASLITESALLEDAANRRNIIAQAAEKQAIAHAANRRELIAEASAAREAEAALHQIYDVVDVLDGDTITIEIAGELQDVRLAGVDTPETAKDWLGKAGMPFADEALQFTQAFLIDAEIEFDQTTDRETYDRLIGDVKNLTGESLQQALAAQGLALPLPVELTGDEEMTAELTALATQAAITGQGIFENQTVASEFLAGHISSMNDVVLIYEEQAEAQQRLTDAWINAAGPVNEATYEIKDAYGNLTGEIAVDSESIANDLRKIAYEAFLTKNGYTESTIAMGVAMGVLTQEQGEARLAFANTQIAIEDLIARQDELGLSDNELIEATNALIDGLAQTPEEAANAANGIADLRASAYETIDSIHMLEDSLNNASGNYSATFVTNYETQGTPPSFSGGGGLRNDNPISMDIGGWVPGPRMKPQLIIAHGGEYILTPDEADSLRKNNMDPSMLFTGSGTRSDSRVDLYGIGSNQPTQINQSDSKSFSITVQVYANGNGDDIAQKTKRSVMDAARQLGVPPA